MIKRRQFIVTVAAGAAGASAVGGWSGPEAQADPTADGWQADPAVIADFEADHPDLNFREDHVPDFDLPDPLVTENGRPITSVAGWRYRRRETLELFRRDVYGRRPRAAEHRHHRFEIIEEDRSAMDGAATLKRISIRTHHGRRRHEFEVIVFLPNGVRRPVGLFLLLNNRGPENTDPTRAHISEFWPAEQVIERGYGIAALQVNDLAPDDAETFTDGIIGLFEHDHDDRAADAWGALSAWGWGASRALDYFETDDRIDAERVAVIGHSRGGKAALWASAEDERFALTISNDSGCGGAALSRRRFGETLDVINNAFPHWFCRNFSSYNGAEDSLPVDQHQLIALVAPRPVCVASADEDLWADPRGEFQSLAHASPVYALWGNDPVAADAMPALDQPLRVAPRSYHIRPGIHDLTAKDWGYYTDAADQFWARQ